MRIVLENIKELVQVEDYSVRFKTGSAMSSLGVLKNAYLVIHDGLIEGIGSMRNLDHEKLDNDVLMELDCTERLVFPSYCDSYTSLIFPGGLENELTNRISRPFCDAAGCYSRIKRLAALIENCSEEELYELAEIRLNEMISLGIGAIEIKCGYGFTSASELKILRVIKKLKNNYPVIIKSKFLGAHTVSSMYLVDRQRFIDLVVHEIIPQISAEGLADYIDVFCDHGFFSVPETKQILTAVIKYGLRPKLYINENGETGGMDASVKYDVLSMDHMQHTNEEEIRPLKNTETMPAMLPGVIFFMKIPSSPVRKMVSAGIPVTMSLGYDQDTLLPVRMNVVPSMECIHDGMSPEEVINATTLNSAYAMGIEGICGSICRGKTANVFITTELPGYASLPYNFGSNLIETVILDGKIMA
ncbi:MAG: amidohydrolase family protein [Prolixibacteraceae bacterium]